MIFAPKCIGNRTLDKETLEKDRKGCRRIGPCGIGKEALYLNSFYIDRRYYVTFTDVRRVFKRVAMSSGGFTGKGLFGSIPYLVVQMSDGTEKQCNFKVEEMVDQFLEIIEREHPDIPVHSKEAEKKLREAAAAEEARYLKVLPEEAQKTIGELERAKNVLNVKEELAENLSLKARQKRMVDGTNPTYGLVAKVIFAAAVACALLGVWSVLQGWGYSAEFVPFALAAIFMIAALRVRPTAGINRQDAQKEWNEALAAMKEYLAPCTDFPVPAQYAHPIVLDRMIRVIREGRAQTAADAFDIMKKDLKALNSTVKVSQKEHDEVIAVKPIFLLCDYQ